MKQFFFCIFALLLTVACNDNNKQLEALQTETNDIHDAAMKDMAAMNRVAREIKQLMISATLTPEQSATYTSALSAIGDAENEMMAWMANYKAPTDMAASEAIKYLQEQKALIEKNHVAIKAATETATKLLPQELR